MAAGFIMKSVETKIIHPKSYHLFRLFKLLDSCCFCTFSFHPKKKVPANSCLSSDERKEKWVLATIRTYVSSLLVKKKCNPVREYGCG